jgi:WD40 repeat protein
VLAASSGPTISLWDLSSGNERTSLQGHRAAVSHLAFSPDGRILASSDKAGLVILWHWSSARKLATLSPNDPHQLLVSPLAFTPDGKVLAVANQDGRIGLWDVAAGKRLGSLGDGSHSIMAMTTSPDGGLLIAGTMDGSIECWDLNTHEQSAALLKHAGVSALAFSQDGRHLVSAGIDGTVRLWLRGVDLPSLR